MTAEAVTEEFYMSKRTFAGVVAGLLFAVGGVALQVHGSEMDEGTMITFAQPVEIPGQVLRPGTYYFVRIDHGNAPDVNLIQIFNSNQTKLIATIHTVTAERRLDTSGKTVLTFAETAKDAPLALRSWFYPGSLEGHEFLYPRREERHVEEAKQIAIAADENGEVTLRAVSGD
jgi:hypothetical protein